MKPGDLDKLICDYTRDIRPIPEGMIETLAPYLFNKIFSDKNIHTMPDDNEHFESKDCWCSPNLAFQSDETGQCQYIHTDTRKEALQ